MEVSNQVFQSLDSCLPDLADLHRHEVGPLVFVESVLEGVDLSHVGHVDEGLAHVAPIGTVDGKVEEVLTPQELLVDDLQKHCLGVLVRDVLDHQASAGVLLHHQSGLGNRLHLAFLVFV